MALLSLVLAQLGCLLGLAATAWALGWLAWGRRGEERLTHPLGLAIGMAILGEIGLLLAAVHRFEPALLFATVVLVHLAALPGWAGLVARGGRVLGTSPRRAGALALLAVLAGGGSFVIALYPPTGFDETTYHLPLARAFLATGGLPWVPDLRFPAFPVLAEALQAMLLVVGGERAAHLVELLAVLVAAALVARWGREAGEPAAGQLGAALLVGSPLVVYLGGMGYVDVVLALLATASFYALWRARREERAGGLDVGWLALAGALAGAAAAVKYLGLYCGLVGVAVLARRGRWRGLGAFLLATVLAAAPIYAYLMVRTGNPLFPYAPGLFGSNPWVPVEPARSHVTRIAEGLLLPWNAVFDRDRAGMQPPLAPPLPLALVLLAALLLARRFPLPAGLRGGALVVLGYLPLLVLTPSAAHYLTIVLPLWCLLAGGAAVAAWRWRSGRALSARTAAAVAVVLALVGPAYGVSWLVRRGPVPLSGPARAAYLARVHPVYSALSWVRRHGGEGAMVYAVHGEYLHAFTPPRLLGDWSGPHRYDLVVPLLDDPPALRRELASFGVTHLLLREGQAPALRQPSVRGALSLAHTVDGFEVWALSSSAAASPPTMRR
ncbi:MAG TPA: glycosyltransferase family 39 protein [Thermoanaerobaculia bacterium]|nr:glycosyltransferase family 39 protein [Thermoanaerobaculia bacterium]